MGKGSVVAKLRADHPEVWLSVSATTRAPRQGELDGREYHFVSKADFDRLVADGQMLEWAEVFGMNRYGTPRAAVAAQLSKGHPVILEIDLDGARQVRQSAPEAIFVFIAPPSRAELLRRLTGRGTETAAEIEQRTKTADLELAAQSEFDHVIVNRDVTEAARELALVMGLVSA